MRAPLAQHPRRITELERSVAALLATLAALQRGTGADLAAEARRAIRTAAAAPQCERARASWAASSVAALRPPSAGDAPGRGVAAVLAEWYAAAVLADQRCLGVAVSEARCAPTQALRVSARGGAAGPAPRLRQPARAPHAPVPCQRPQICAPTAAYQLQGRSSGSSAAALSAVCSHSSSAALTRPHMTRQCNIVLALKPHPMKPNVFTRVRARDRGALFCTAAPAGCADPCALAAAPELHALARLFGPACLAALGAAAARPMAAAVAGAP